MENKKERIAKRIAAAGLCSRRDAEQWILAGRVTVNGQKLATPAFTVDEADVIVVDGKPIVKPETVRMWRYYKPIGLVTTHKDPSGRPTVFESLPTYLPRVVSVGRLDLNSEGLLLLTTSGEVSRALELPTKGWKRKYRVRIHGKITDDAIAKLQKGVTVEGIRYAPALVEIELNQTTGTNQWLAVTLTEGKNREVRKLLNAFGYQVNRLIRVAYGPFQLGNMKPGEVQEIPQKVIKEQI